MASEIICWQLTGNIIIGGSGWQNLIGWKQAENHDWSQSYKKESQADLVCVRWCKEEAHYIANKLSFQQITHNLIKSVDFTTVIKKMEGAGTWKMDIIGMQSTKSEYRHLSRPKWQCLPQIDCKEKGVLTDFKTRETPKCRWWILIQIYQLLKQANKQDFSRHPGKCEQWQHIWWY